MASCQANYDSLAKRQRPESTTEKSEKRCKLWKTDSRSQNLPPAPLGAAHACQLDRSSTTANLTDLSGSVKSWLEPPCQKTQNFGQPRGLFNHGSKLRYLRSLAFFGNPQPGPNPPAFSLQTADFLQSDRSDRRFCRMCLTRWRRLRALWSGTADGMDPVWQINCRCRDEVDCPG